MKQPVRVRLAAQTPGNGDLVMELAEGRPWFVIGRGAGVDLSLDDLTVGKRHCQFQLASGQVKVQNLDHARGTWRNGMPIDDVDDLTEGDRIEIGDLAFQAKIEAMSAVAAAPEAPAPAAQVIAPPAPVEPVSAPPPSPPAEPEPATPPAPAPVVEVKHQEPAVVEAPVARHEPQITRAGSMSREPAARAERAPVRMPPIHPTARSAGTSTPAANASRSGLAGGATARVTAPRNPSRSSVRPGRFTPPPEPPAAPSPPPSPAEPPAPLAAPVIGPADAFTRNLIEDLQANFKEHVARYGPGELQGLIQRCREHAKKLGFMSDEEVQQFMQCVVLLNDELSGQNAHNSDVWFTLTMVNRPAAMRLKRAMTISQRMADTHGPGGRAPEEAQAAVAAPVAPPERAPSPPPAQQQFERVREEPPPALREFERAPSPPPAPGPIEEARRPEPARAREFDRPQPPRAAEPEPAAREFEPPARAPSPPPPAPPSSRREPQLREVPPTPAHDLGPVPEIEGFQIIGRLGSGGMGDVYKALDVQLDVEVAIKILRSMHPTAQEQFLAEARSAAKLQHPNIVQVQRYGQIGDMGYYAMQLILGQDGEQLLRKLREQVPQLKAGNEILTGCGIDPNVITPDLRAAAAPPKPYYRIVAAWMAGIADGLERAHSMGVVHRDIKPDNMILASDGRMMLLDFGLAMRKSDDRSAHANLCVGTPRYLSPEMLAAWAAGSGMQGTDERVDIWGLGATLYEFLAFRPAYDGPVSRVLRDIATLDPTPPREYVWQVPEEIEAICLKALHRNPEERYRRAAEMADELRRWLAGEAPGASVDRAAATGGKGKQSGIFSWLKKK
jgi:serine/threonine protein kinase